MSRLMIVLAVVAALVASILVSSRWYPQTGTAMFAEEDEFIFGGGGEQVASAPPATGDTTATGVASQPEVEAPYFAFRRLEVQTSGETPEACLVFTRKLDDSGNVRYEDYLKFDPELTFAVRVTQERLCVQGLSFGKTYTLQLREGLPALKGYVFGKVDETFQGTQLTMA
ncbi:MAG: hypothetical protein ACK6A4_18880, partial [Alphaproteobacteria bacterium]